MLGSAIRRRRVKNSVVCSLRSRQTARLLTVARQLLSDNLRGDQRLLHALDNDEDAIAPARTGSIATRPVVSSR